MTVQRNTEDVQAFERRSSHYENSLSQRLFFGRIHRIALDAVPAGFEPGAILDIGCGTGRLLRAAARRWPHAHLEKEIQQERTLNDLLKFPMSLTLFKLIAVILDECSAHSKKTSILVINLWPNDK